MNRQCVSVVLAWSLMGLSPGSAPQDTPAITSQITLVAVDRSGPAVSGNTGSQIAYEVGAYEAGALNIGLPSMRGTIGPRTGSLDSFIDGLKLPKACVQRQFAMLKAPERYWTYADGRVKVRWGDYANRLALDISNNGQTPITLSWAASTIRVGNAAPAPVLGAQAAVECGTVAILLAPGDTYADALFTWQADSKAFGTPKGCLSGQSFKIAISIQDGIGEVPTEYTFSFQCGAVRK